MGRLVYINLRVFLGGGFWMVYFIINTLDLKPYSTVHWHEYSALPPNFVNCHFTSVWFYVISRPKFSIKNS